MKVFSKFLIAAFVALPALVIASPIALADSPGQLTGGSNVLQVKNITRGGSYASTASASCNEELQYSIMLHNAAYGGLTNVVVKANLANGTITAVPAEGVSTGTSGSVTVNIASNGNLTYRNGSARLYNASGSVIRDLSDTLTTSGVNIGDISGSTTEFVNFQAIVNCPTAPEKPVTLPAEELPNTGPGAIAGIFAGSSVLGTIGHYILRRRR